jgi:hypothetical protein
MITAIGVDGGCQTIGLVATPMVRIYGARELATTN